MKITDIKTIICHAYRTNWVFVKVLTDSPHHGVGEATLEMREQTVAAAVHDLARGMIGEDPRDIELLWHRAYRDSYWRGGPVLMSALAGVEMALWDIKGKALGVPVHQLLGGKFRRAVPCYANGWFVGAGGPDQFAAKAREAVAAGFKGLKWDPFGSAYMQLDRKEFNAAIACVEAVAGAVGGQVDLFVEGHGRFNVPTAVRVGHALESFDISWFEEPVPPDDPAGLAEVKRRIRVPVAAGERIYSRWDYCRFVEAGCADYLQPDVSHVGGIGELKKIAAMAECHHMPVCPHNPSGPVANAATLQLAACVPNFHLLETMSTDVPHRREISTERIALVDGMMQIGDAPGLGIELNERAIAEYPYKPRDLRHYNGKLTQIRPHDAVSYFL